jgi:hypothetical protein
MQQYLIINRQSGKPFLMGAEIGLFLEPCLWVSKLVSKLETGNWYLRHWIHEKNKIRASMTSVVTSIHNFKQESLFRIKACRGVAFCEAGSSLGPLHLSSVLYKSPFFMQNKPNLLGAQMNVSIYYLKAYKNETAFRRVKNKPNSNPNKPNFRKAQMNVNSFITKDYRKKDDFSVRINKPNFVKGPK